jgi:hypothetical protein
MSASNLAKVFGPSIVGYSSLEPELVYDAFSVTTLYSVDDRVTGEC